MVDTISKNFDSETILYILDFELIAYQNIITMYFIKIYTCHTEAVPSNYGDDLIVENLLYFLIIVNI